MGRVKVLNWMFAVLLVASTAMTMSANCIAREHSQPGAPGLAPRPSANVFISGHSLTDQPMPDHLAAIAASLGTPLQWNRQYVVGSSILARSRGAGPAAAAWSGYRAGIDKLDNPIDVLQELKAPKGISGRYDTLLITEQHGLLGSLTWNDTVRHLRHYHDRMIQSNIAGTTFFYESWLDIDDKSRPQRWVTYERAASPIWQCIATRVNASLGAEGRPDRIRSLPMGLALAELVDLATQGPGLPGVTLGTVRETVDSLVKDNVHLTETGSYFAALVTYSTLFAKSPEGAWGPANVRPATASALQRAAGTITANYLRTNKPLTLEQCKETLLKSFIQQYWGYTRDAIWQKEQNFVQRYFRWARFVVEWQWRIRRSTNENPLHLDQASDRDYWFPAP